MGPRAETGGSRHTRIPATSATSAAPDPINRFCRRRRTKASISRLTGSTLPAILAQSSGSVFTSAFECPEDGSRLMGLKRGHAESAEICLAPLHPQGDILLHNFL